MSWRTFWLFATVTFFVSATPGPNMFLVMSSSARFGFRASLATMAGCLTALLAMLGISAAGLGALLQAFPTVFDALRWMLVAASNPKAILFAAAFLPQFIHPELPKLPQFTILLLTFAVIEVSWYIVYAGSGQHLAQYLRRTSVLRLFNRLTGSVFVGFAAVMAAVRD